MQIRATIKLQMVNNCYNDLYLIVKFRIPKRLFKIKLECLIASEFKWGHDMFLSKCEYLINNDDELIRLAKKEIREYFEQYESKRRVNNIYNGIKNINNKKLNIKVEMLNELWKMFT